MALTATQQSAQDYINKIGGVSAYTANQQAKLKEAQASGNTDMLNRLTADAARTGLSYGQTAAPIDSTPKDSSFGIASMPSTSGGGGWLGVANKAALLSSTSAMPGAIAGTMVGMSTNTNAAPSAPKEIAPIAQPVSAQQSYQPPDYAALAAARTALALRNKQTIANQQKASADASYNQQNLRTRDDRVLSDQTRTQTANPFGNMGRKSFQEGLIGRERTQQDADAAASLQTQKSNIDQMLADYQNATADEQVRIADELQRADRQYQLDLANSTGNLTDLNTGQSQRTLQGQQFDYNTNPNNPNNQGQVLQNQGQALQNQLTQFKLNDYPAESQAAAQQIQQQLTSGSLSNEAAAYNLQQLKDPNSAMNQAQKIDLQLKQLDLRNAPEEARLKLQQLKKQIADIGVVHRQPQTTAEAEYDKQQVIKIKAEIDKIKNPSAAENKSSTAEGYASYIDGMAQYATDQATGKKTLSNPIDVESSILQSKLPESEMKKLYTRYGLKWGG